MIATVCLVWLVWLHCALFPISCFLFARSHLSNPNRQQNLAPCWIPEKRKPSLMTNTQLHSFNMCVLKPNMSGSVCVCVCVCVCACVQVCSRLRYSFSLILFDGMYWTSSPPCYAVSRGGVNFSMATKSLSLHVVLSHGALGEFGLVPLPARSPVSFLFSSCSCLDSNGTLSTVEALRWNMFSPLLFSGWTKTGHTLLGPPLSLAGHCSAWGKSICSLLSISLIWLCLST